jgi:hypothetical protein
LRYFGRLLSNPEIFDLLATGTMQPSIAARLNYCLIENLEAGKDLQVSLTTGLRNGGAHLVPF